MASHFTVLVNGQIESALFPEYDGLYCKFSFCQGPDWTVVSGAEQGMTQQSQKQPALSSATSLTPISAPTNVWNFPLDLAFRSTNAFGWPQLVLAVFGPDMMGRDVIRGYGWNHIPMQPGKHVLYIPMYAPVASSTLNSILSSLAGKQPEFLDPKFVTKNDGREVTRVRSQGTVKVVVHVITKDLERLGYHNTSNAIANAVAGATLAKSSS